MSNTETCSWLADFVEPHGDDGLGGLRVFGDVGQRLGDNEVRDRLRLVGQPARQMDFESRRDPEVLARCTTDDSAASRPRSARIVGAMPRTTLRSSTSALLASSCASAISCLGCRQVSVELGLRQTDRHGQRHQPRLHAVVQVPLDAVPLGLRRRHRALPGVGKRADLVLQCRGRRRRQQPPVDGRVECRREDQDGGSGDQRHRGQQEGQRRRQERQSGVVVALPDRDRSGGPDKGKYHQRERETRRPRS